MFRQLRKMECSKEVSVLSPVGNSLGSEIHFYPSVHITTHWYDHRVNILLIQGNEEQL